MGWGRGAEEAVGMSLEEVAVLGQHTGVKGEMESTKTMVSLYNRSYNV